MMTPAQRERKISKLHRIRIDLSAEARNVDLPSADRMHLARAADALRTAIEAMEATSAEQAVA